MALVLANRVQETATANTTVSFTLAGAVLGFQTFAVIGDTNTTYYSATDTAGNWETGLGTYATSGPTLTRTTIYASSNSNTAVTFSGTVNVFVTYPSGKSVNLDGSGNVSALGTVASGTWQGSTIGVSYGGTGVTTSSGANSVVLRDANQNIAVNRLNQANTDVTAAAGTTALTAASTYSQTLVGTGGQTFTMPDATTLTTGVAFVFNNNATGTLTLQDYASGSIGTITSGGAAELVLLANGTVAGTWDVHGFLPEAVTWGTNALALGSTVISGGTWQGGTIASGYGGTGLTTFTAANYALYSTSASALTAGTLPVAAGGTGLTSGTSGGVLYYSASGTLASSAALASNALVIGGGAGVAPSTITTGTGVVTALGVNTGTAGAFVVNGGALGTPSSGTLTSCTGLPLTTGVTGTLPVANGGTGLTAGTSGGVLYYSASGTLASSAALASSAIVLGGGAGSAPATTTTGTGVVTAVGNAVNTSGGLVTQSGTLASSALLLGGGASTAITSTTTGTGVVTALGVNTGSAGAFVVFDGALGTPSSGTVTNLTGTASININGTVGATTPNTGAFTSVTSTSASGILTRAAATQDGMEIIGRAGGTSSYKVTQTPTTLTASRTVTWPDANVNFTTGLGVAQGGTGQTSYTDGQLLIGNTSGNTLTKATLTGTSNQITVTNGNGSITLATPQSINTTASVQFGSFGVGTAASGTTGEIRATNNVTAYYSDDRLKTRLGKIENALDKLCSLDGFYYEANQTAQELGYEVKREVGVSAQQVQAVMPEIVAPAPIDDRYLTVRYERALPLLIEAIKELREEVRALKG